MSRSKSKRLMHWRRKALSRRSSFSALPLWLGALAVVWVAGCSSTGRHFTSLDESLTIQIMPNTSKLFVYSLAAPEGVRRNLVQIYNSPSEAGQHRNREPEGERTYRQLRQNAERAVKATGYCREGFLQLDYRLSRDDLWLRGECREGATEEDIERFADLDELIVPKAS